MNKWLINKILLLTLTLQLMPLTYTEIAPTTMSKLNTIGFIYQVENIALQPLDDTLQVTAPFISQDIISLINEKLKPQNFKVDESSLQPKFTDGKLRLEGFAVEIQQPKTVGFLSGR